MERLIMALREIGRMAKEDGAIVGFPGFLRKNETNVDGYQKQPCTSEHFECEYIIQSGGISGDDFSGEILYPFEEWYIKVHFVC